MRAAAPSRPGEASGLGQAIVDQSASAVVLVECLIGLTAFWEANRSMLAGRSPITAATTGWLGVALASCVVVLYYLVQVRPSLADFLARLDEHIGKSQLELEADADGIWDWVFGHAVRSAARGIAWYGIWGLAWFALVARVAPVPGWRIAPAEALAILAPPLVIGALFNVEQLLRFHSFGVGLYTRLVRRTPRARSLPQRLVDGLARGWFVGLTGVIALAWITHLAQGVTVGFFFLVALLFVNARVVVGPGERRLLAHFVSPGDDLDASVPTSTRILLLDGAREPLPLATIRMMHHWTSTALSRALDHLAPALETRPGATGDPITHARGEVALTLRLHARMYDDAAFIHRSHGRRARRVEFDLADAVRRICRALPVAWHAHLDLTLPSAALAVRGDEEGIERAIREIVLNACVAMAAAGAAPDGRLQITLGLAEARGTVEVQVVDDGPPLAAPLADRLEGARFVPYASGHPQPFIWHDHLVGVGMGLFITHQIARAHGGMLRVGRRTDAPRGCVARMRIKTRGDDT